MSVKELVRTLVCSIVDNEDLISIEEEDDDSGLSYNIAVSKDDVGKLIGTKGRIASAIRTVVKAAGAKQGVRVLVNINKNPLEG